MKTFVRNVRKLAGLIFYALYAMKEKAPTKYKKVLVVVVSVAVVG